MGFNSRAIQANPARTGLAKNPWLIRAAIFISYFVFAILLNSVGTVILQVQNSFGVSAGAAGVLEAFKDLPIAITSFLVASFLVRLGYKNSMMLALGLVGAVCLAMPLLPFFWMSKLMFAATGVGFALVKISVLATLGLVTHNQAQHASLMSFLESFFMLGVMSGYFIFGVFVDDQAPDSTRWLNVYYVLAALCASAIALLAVSRLDESGVRQSVTTTGWSDFLDMLRLCLRPLVLVFVASAFLYVLIEQSIMSWLPSFNSKVLHLPASLSIQLTSILAAATALGRFTAGIVLRRFDWFRVLTLGLLVAAVLVLLSMPLAGRAQTGNIHSWLQAPLAAFVFPLIGFCIAPVYPAINSVILSSLPLRQHAPMAGLIVVFSALGGTSGSLITGALFQAYGGQTAFYFSLLPIAMILLSLYALKHLSSETLAEQPGPA